MNELSNSEKTIDFKEIDAQPIGWREAGSGEPILFLHAMAGSRTGWDAQLNQFADKYRCIAWDMPGFGQSTALADDGAMGDVVETLATFIQNTLQLDKAHIVGHSVGGMIAQEFAIKHPNLLHSMTLIDTSPKFGLGGTMKPEEFADPILEGFKNGVSVDTFSDGMIRAIVAPNCSETITEQAIASMSRARKEGLELTTRLIADHDALERIHTIKTPTLVIAGELDGETPPAYAERIADEIDGATVAIIPGAGHMPNMEKADELNRLLTSFLAKVKS